MTLFGGLLVVRAVVADPADRDVFDRWYREEHLPDAKKVFSALAAWRGWSETDPGVHYAYYRFGSMEELTEVMSGTGIRDLIAEFDAKWQGRVVRTREVVSLKQTI